MNHSFNVTVAELYGLQEAVLLENIYFWCKKNEANNKLTEGEPWTYNTVKAFNTQFKYLSPAVITRALKNLEKEGLIKVGEFNTNAYDHTKWYCITDKCRKYFEDESSKKEPESHPENKKSICDFSKSKNENKNSIDKKEQILITDINSDNKPNINSDTSSPQPDELFDKDSLPQKENSKSHCGKATKEKKQKNKKDKESFPRDYYTQVYDTYFANCKKLYEQGILENEKPVLNYKATTSLLNAKFTEYGFENVLKAVQESINHHWLTHDKKYDFRFIFGPNELPNLINRTYQNFDRLSRNQPNRSSDSQRQWSDEHLIF